MITQNKYEDEILSIKINLLTTIDKIFNENYSLIKNI